MATTTMGSIAVSLPPLACLRTTPRTFLHINDIEEFNEEMMTKGATHQEKVKKSLKAFPNVAVEEFPSEH